MIRAIVFDIDGTLADITHRLHFIQKTPKDWEGFFSSMLDDKPIAPVRLVCESLLALKNMEKRMGAEVSHTVIFCSGRPDKYRKETLAWMQSNIYPVPQVLYMRKTGDRRPDDVVKEELLTQMRADGYDPVLVFEDRQRVVDMWRRNGIQCCQVASGDF